jgi:hypothetical protein
MSITLTTNYAGKYAGQYIAKAVLAGRMLENDNCQKFLAVKSKMNAPVVSLNGVIKPYTEDFVAAGSVVISEKVLDPAKFSVQLAFSIDTLEQMWESEKMAAGMGGSGMPQDFQSFVVAYIQKQVRKEVDNYLWNSDTAGTGVLAQVDGWLKQFGADAAVADVTASTLTQANILAEITKVYQALPEDVSEEDTRIFMSVGSHKLLKAALASREIYAQNENIAATMLYDQNVKLVSVPGFPANTMVGTASYNLIFGTDLESDMQSFSLIDMRQTTGDRKLRFRMDFKMDVSYGFGSHVVLYKPA